MNISIIGAISSINANIEDIGAININITTTNISINIGGGDDVDAANISAISM